MSSEHGTPPIAPEGMAPSELAKLLWPGVELFPAQKALLDSMPTMQWESTGSMIRNFKWNRRIGYHGNRRFRHAKTEAQAVWQFNRGNERWRAHVRQLKS
jgi:hypothetical protein